MRHRLSFAVCSIVFASAAASAAPEEDPAPAEAGRLALTTERAVVFKDGYCLVVKSATGTSTADGTVFTEDVPDAAVLGSFWATPSEGRLLTMTAGMRETSSETTETLPCSQYLEVLTANVGKQATIDLDDGSTVRGVVRRVLTRTETQPLPPVAADLRYVEFSALARAAGAREGAVLSGSLFVVATDEGDVVLPVGRVKRLVVREAKLDLDRKVTEKRSSKRLTFKFEGGAAQRTLHIIYFRPGVRWIPTYRIEVPEGPAAEGKRAHVRLQAELLNEAEDLVDVPIDVVVGVPNFRFKDVVSPFVLESALRDALRQAAPQLMGQQMLQNQWGNDNNAFLNRSGERRGRGGGEDEGAGAIAIPDEITAGQSHDLFTYSLPSISLKKGERAAVQVFDADVPYRDVYTWDLQVARKDVEASPSGAGTSPLVLSQARVWHQIELVNGTRVPWTTGAAMIVAGRQPLAQELLTYTSAGGSVRVPVTVAVDLRGSFSEEETGRQLNAQRWLSDSYARIEKKGRIEITNFKKEAVDVEIVCSLGGRASEATDGGKIVLGSFRKEDWNDYTGHPAVNNHSAVSFLLHLAPGATITPELKYHYFTRQ